LGFVTISMRGWILIRLFRVIRLDLSHLMPGNLTILRYPIGGIRWAFKRCGSSNFRAL